MIRDTVEVQKITSEDPFVLYYIQSGYPGLWIEVCEDPFDLSVRLVNEKEMQRKLDAADKIPVENRPD